MGADYAGVGLVLEEIWIFFFSLSWVEGGRFAVVKFGYGYTSLFI